MDQIGRVPVVGERVTVAGLELAVVQRDGLRVTELSVTVVAATGLAGAVGAGGRTDQAPEVDA
jgi:Mg2+/Co2+ transporter CorC